MAKPRYLGDGVYADIERGMLKLWTYDGITITNIIWMEPEVWNNLKTYVSFFTGKPTETEEVNNWNIRPY